MRRSAATCFLVWTAAQEDASAFVPVHSRSSRVSSSSRHASTDESTEESLRQEKLDTWRRQDLFGQSLVDQTLTEMEADADFQATSQRYAELGAAQITKEERARRRRALDDLGTPSFQEFLQQQGVNPFQRKAPSILQINIGLYCNQACGHCHVESSPLRTTEQMTAETAAQCVKLLEQTPSIKTLDITGGAPELNEHFRYLVRMARSLRPDLEIIDRCNLTVLQEPEQEDLIDFLKDQNVRIVASLPCYSEENVDQQRGNGVFERSIAALLALNEAGYAQPGTGLTLDLVYNPGGAFLPPDQANLQVSYKQQLDENFGILFDSLFTMTNMPIKRFADFLHQRKQLKEYMELLVQNFNTDTTESVMCLDTISIGWDGRIYDCDFNQQVGYALGSNEIHQGGLTIFDIDTLDLTDIAIRNDNHCFGCTAGMGSS